MITSMLYFWVTPLESTHSELLNRTSPTFFDVAVAFFGGLAAIIAIISRKKGTVLPGVALATSLLPPLCSIGYGMVVWSPKTILGGGYLFAINLAFIALAAMIVSLMMKFPRLKNDHRDSLKYSGVIIAIFSILTAIPSIYFGTKAIVQAEFRTKAEKFINAHAELEEPYLLKKVVNAAERKITLVYGGEAMNEETREKLLKNAEKYHLKRDEVIISQGITALKAAIQEKNTNISALPIQPKNKDAEKIIAAEAEL